MPATGLRALVERDAAELLYNHGLGGLCVTAISASAFVIILPSAISQLRLVAWLTVMLILVLARAVDLVSGRERRRRPDWCGRGEIRRFSRGILGTAVLWALFPLLFFREMDALERTTLAIVVSAMAGSSATVLAASQRLAIAYCGALLLPTSLMFLLTPGHDSLFLGLVGIVFFIVLASASRATHDATMTAVALNRANSILLDDMDRERLRTATANAELTVAQAELRQTLETLEERIAERTVDLEHEIAERERYARELALLASRDSLTGLCNRGTLMQLLVDEQSVAEREGTSLAVLFLDLDRFKEVNDFKGHQWGDRVLCEVANRVSVLVPDHGACARWGGDEFVFVTMNQSPAAARADAEALAERLRAQVSEPMRFGAESVSVDATIGIAIYPEHGHSADELIRAADMAMYAAKQNGRGYVRMFDPALADELRARHELEEALRGAVVNGELFLEFQPIVDAGSGRCEALEALLRWNHPRHGIISPLDFIPLAERTGDIINIGRWVMREACAAAARWPGDDAPAVSLNLSILQIVGGSVLEDLEAALVQSGLPPRRLHVEVTESVFAGEPSQVIGVLAALRERGVRVLLDDFGTGFSSLSYLRSLPIDTLKIDKSFIDDARGESGSIIKAIRSLADAFEIGVIAEGVETTADAALLLELGVRSLQGFLFARPIPEGEVVAWLDDLAAGSLAPTTRG